nr:ATP-binding protein [uncultured Blautia sp.]
MKGTYRRDFEGDFLCTEAAVRAMFADQRDISVDSEILEDMELDALNTDTIKGYRIIFEQLHEGHPWNKLMKDEFLIKLKAAAKNKKGTVSPTVAGILMFGEADRITDVFPDYFLDYREECDDKKVRWLYRTHSNEGDWSGNLFDFFYKVTTRIDDDVAVPFVKRREGVRVDRVDVHDALSEAVANALVHANYYGKRGIVIVKHGKTITISNPRTIRITKEEFYAGGNSDPRNPNLLKIFGFVNMGERAGSGVDKIMTAWEEQNWEKPIYDISLRAERVTLQLEVGQIVYIPGAADLRKEGKKETPVKVSLNDREQILVEYLKVYGTINMKKATELCGYKARSATRKLINKMVQKQMIRKIGDGQNTRYELINGLN